MKTIEDWREYTKEIIDDVVRNVDFEEVEEWINKDYEIKADLKIEDYKELISKWCNTYYNLFIINEYDEIQHLGFETNQYDQYKREKEYYERVFKKGRLL